MALEPDYWNTREFHEAVAKFAESFKAAAPLITLTMNDLRDAIRNIEMSAGRIVVAQASVPPPVVAPRVRPPAKPI